MGLPARLRSTKLEALWVVLGVLGSWALRLTAVMWLGAWLQVRAYGDWYKGTAAGSPVYYLLDQLFRQLVTTLDVAIAAGTLAMPLVLLARLLARARVRSGRADPLDRVRRWTERHPRMTRALTAVPGALTTAAVSLEMARRGWTTSLPYAVVPLLGLTWLTRLGLRALLAPTLGAAADEAPHTVADDEIVFSAVAVTRETVATVGAFAVLPLVAVLALTLLGPRGDAGENGAFVAVMLTYIAVAGGGAALFQRASRIAVGIDGVLVRGTSRTRFVAYRDLDAVTVHGANVDLVRAGRVVMRLQLHGEDAARRGPIVARIEEKIARAAARRDGATEGFVAASTREQLTRAVAGAVDFR
ncbi:MAG TPA: hypothetical protein VE987_18765, partial [Polyangiaceae bacterium]|nr:hypothetical protein [Polyangiaceae bacterium]